MKKIIFLSIMLLSLMCQVNAERNRGWNKEQERDHNGGRIFGRLMDDNVSVMDFGLVRLESAINSRITREIMELSIADTFGREKNVKYTDIDFSVSCDYEQRTNLLVAVVTVYPTAVLRRDRFVLKTMIVNSVKAIDSALSKDDSYISDCFMLRGQSPRNNLSKTELDYIKSRFEVRYMLSRELIAERSEQNRLKFRDFKIN